MIASAESTPRGPMNSCHNRMVPLRPQNASCALSRAVHRRQLRDHRTLLRRAAGLFPAAPLSKASGKRAGCPGEAPPNWLLLAETPLPGASPPAASHKAVPVGSESRGPVYRVCGSGAHLRVPDSDRLLNPDIVEIARQLASGIRRTRLRQALCGMHTGERSVVRELAYVNGGKAAGFSG